MLTTARSAADAHHRGVVAVVEPDEQVGASWRRRGRRRSPPAHRAGSCRRSRRRARTGSTGGHPSQLDRFDGTVTPRRRTGAWWPSRSSKPVKPSTSAWRVRFPSASAHAHGWTWGGAHVSDPRRLVPRTDAVLADPAAGRRGRTARTGAGQGAVDRGPQRSATGGSRRSDVADAGRRDARATRPTSLRAGDQRDRRRAAHQPRPRAAVRRARARRSRPRAGYVDVEYDLATGQRARRGRGALAALRRAVPRRRGRARRQQRRRRAAAGHDRAGRRPRGDRSAAASSSRSATGSGCPT